MHCKGSLAGKLSFRFPLFLPSFARGTWTGQPIPRAEHLQWSQRESFASPVPDNLLTAVIKWDAQPPVWSTTPCFQRWKICHYGCTPLEGWKSKHASVSAGLRLSSHFKHCGQLLQHLHFLDGWEYAESSCPVRTPSKRRSWQNISRQLKAHWIKHVAAWSWRNQLENTHFVTISCQV